MNEGYHQLELDDDSRHLTTFYGTDCKMMYTRLNYGTISAQDIFDKAMDDTVAGLNGVLHIRDDFIVFGKGNTPCTTSPIKEPNGNGHKPSKQHLRNPRTHYQVTPEGWKAIECASHSLTEVEKRYPQIDREALAIRWACERCYKYLIESSFVIETDHQPLIPLFNNPHSRPPMRSERWLLYLQQFDYQLKYCPGKQNTADNLSRHMLSLTESDLQTS